MSKIKDQMIMEQDEMFGYQNQEDREYYSEQLDPDFDTKLNEYRCGEVMRV